MHTDNFPAILQELNASVLVTTYQAGKLVMLRPDGERLNTHFLQLQCFDGLAVALRSMAIGTSLEIWEYHNALAMAPKLNPPGTHDACFLPGSSVCTGNANPRNIMGLSLGRRSRTVVCQHPLLLPAREVVFTVSYRDGGLPFITGTGPEDRCHLNGLGMVDWLPGICHRAGCDRQPTHGRDNKKSGGILIEIASGEIIAWACRCPIRSSLVSGRLWVLDSGNGGFGFIDPATGKYESVAVPPGFTFADWISAAPWLSSVCRMSAKVPCSVASRLPIFHSRTLLRSSS
ncbi:MAG: DUF4915 domain-containing protein [Gemmataceae bacterium]